MLITIDSTWHCHDLTQFIFAISNANQSLIAEKLFEKSLTPSASAPLAPPILGDRIPSPPELGD
ncbi:MAG: hypothetical protein VKJ46_06005, partial [Leptolyngbyaceae bacterium]|nr:hypothetical protein [Leptolyngbyaceae bacterium]